MSITSELTIETTVFGRIGELMQLRTPEGSRIIVSGPVAENLYSRITLMEGEGSFPSDEDWKSSKAIDIFLQSNTFRSCADLPGFIYESTIPRGKGLSSSSADIIAVILSLNRYYGMGLSDPEIYSMAATIEPTDPLLNSDTVVFNSGTGEMIEQLPPLPMTAIYFDADPGGTIPTPDITSLSVCRHGMRVVDEFVNAWKAKDYATVFRLTTQSALNSFSWNLRTVFSPLVDLAKRFEAGIFVAHTGTIQGIISETKNEDPLFELVSKIVPPGRDRRVFMQRFS